MLYFKIYRMITIIIKMFRVIKIYVYPYTLSFEGQSQDLVMDRIVDFLEKLSKWM